MQISPAYAQDAGGAAGGLGGLLLPMLLIFVFFYFFLIRPQRKRMKQHQEMVQSVRRGDVIVTSGGIVGKVSRVIDDNEAEVEIADNVKVKIIKSTISDVRSKSEPANDR